MYPRRRRGTPRCRECGEPLAFVDTANGKIAVDPGPAPGSQLIARRSEGGLVGMWIAKGELVPAGFERYGPHKEACEAVLARKRRRPKPQPQMSLFDQLTTEERRNP